MNITERKYYTCEKCGRTSQNESKIKECEASHLEIKPDAEITVDYARGSMCPDVLKVEMSDGSIATYRFARHDAAKGRLITELDRLLEITNDREQCEFCPDPTWCENICTRCNKVKPITAEELREYFREVRWLISENVRLNGDLELAVQDINLMATGKYNACNFCAQEDCRGHCKFVWRGLEE